MLHLVELYKNESSFETLVFSRSLQEKTKILLWDKTRTKFGNFDTFIHNYRVYDSILVIRTKTKIGFKLKSIAMLSEYFYRS